MVNQQLIDFVKQQKEQGIGEEQIRGSLKAHGWQDADLDEVFGIVFGNIISSSVPPVSSSPINTNSFVSASSQSGNSLMGIKALFRQVWFFYKTKFWTFVGIMVVPMIVMAFSGLLMFGGMLGLFSLFSSKFAIGGFILGIISIILLYILILMIQIWGQVALLCAIKDSQENIGIIESYKRGWGKLSSYLWVIVLSMFVTMGGYLLLIIPGLIFSIWFSMALLIFIVEDLKGMDALLQSKEYVRGKWFDVFWRLFLMGIVFVISSIVLSLILSILKVPFSAQISNLLSGLLLAPFSAIYLFTLYNDLKLNKKEAITPATKKQKRVFVLIGFLGLLLLPTMLFFNLYLNRLNVQQRIEDNKINNVTNNSSNASFDLMRQSQLQMIKVALTIYYDQNQGYPSSLDQLVPKYLLEMPVDPVTSAQYFYQLEKNNTEYKVCAQLSSNIEQCVYSQL